MLNLSKLLDAPMGRGVGPVIADVRRMECVDTLMLLYIVVKQVETTLTDKAGTYPDTRTVLRQRKNNFLLLEVMDRVRRLKCQS